MQFDNVDIVLDSKTTAYVFHMNWVDAQKQRSLAAS